MQSPSKKLRTQIQSELRTQFELSGFQLTKPALSYLSSCFQNEKNFSSYIEPLIEAFSSSSLSTISLEDIKAKMLALFDTKSSIDNINIIPKIRSKQKAFVEIFLFLSKLVKTETRLTPLSQFPILLSEGRTSVVVFVFVSRDKKGRLEIQDATGKFRVDFSGMKSACRKFVLPNSFVLLTGNPLLKETQIVFSVEKILERTLESRKETLKDFEKVFRCKQIKDFTDFRYLVNGKLNRKHYLEFLVNRTVNSEQPARESDDLVLFFGDVSLETDLDSLVFVITTIFTTNLKELYGKDRPLSKLVSVYVVLQSFRCVSSHKEDNTSHSSVVFDLEKTKHKICENILEKLAISLSIDELLKQLQINFTTDKERLCLRSLVTVKNDDLKKEIIVCPFPVFEDVKKRSLSEVKYTTEDLKNSVVKCILEQANLNASFESMVKEENCNKLFPLPNLLVFSERDENPFKFVVEETLVCNTGSFCKQKDFLLFYVGSNEIDLSKYT